MASPDSSRFSDYTPLKVIRDRAARSKAGGDTYYARVTEVLDGRGRGQRPRYRVNFNVFADEVAYGLREKIVYRTDGGKFARALVRANGHLKIVHDYYRTHEAKDGHPLDLTIILVRRQDRQPPFRWVMDILYKINDHIDGDEEVIVEDPERVSDLRCRRLDLLLSTIEVQLHSLPKPAARQLGRMIDIAESAVCPASLDLWYFNRAVMKDYISWRTDDDTRREMTKHTAGRFPFDGHTWPHGEWRSTLSRTSSACTRMARSTSAPSRS